MDKQRCIIDDLSDVKATDLMFSLPNYFEPTGDIDKTAFLNWRFDF